MARDVLCEVNNCKYWNSGTTCNADAIYVISHTGKQASDSKETYNHHMSEKPLSKVFHYTGCLGFNIHL